MIELNYHPLPRHQFPPHHHLEMKNIILDSVDVVVFDVPLTYFEDTVVDTQRLPTLAYL